MCAYIRKKVGRYVCILGFIILFLSLLRDSIFLWQCLSLKFYFDHVTLRIYIISLKRRVKEPIFRFERTASCHRKHYETVSSMFSHCYKHEVLHLIFTITIKDCFSYLSQYTSDMCVHNYCNILSNAICIYKTLQNSAWKVAMRSDLKITIVALL